MRKLDFVGTVQPDAAPQLIIPGREELFLKPEDWPKQLAPGALSIEVNRFPAGFDEIGEGEELARLDAGKFRPTLVIPQRKIVGSTLMPDAEHPTRGFAEAWRTDLQVIGTGQDATCWAIWIIGSDTTKTIRLVAEDDLRSRLKLADGMAVKFTVWEDEKRSQRPTPDEAIASWCEAARNVEGGFGREKALAYLVGEKFLNFLERAETDRDWRQAIPAFAVEIKAIFEPWQLGEYLDRAGWTEPFDATLYDPEDDDYDPEEIEMERKDNVRRVANEMLLIERAKEWLLEDDK
jgi:hypothetical protein